MSLDDEIAIIQFGQGVHADIELLDHFSQLDKQGKRNHLFGLYFLVERSSPVDSDLDQANIDSSPDTTAIPYLILKFKRMTRSVKLNMTEEYLEKTYTLLLTLFKTAYQRRYASEKENPAKWWYWDLSNKAIVQSILTSHQELVQAVYDTPGFRSEFASIAKLWHDRKASAHAKLPEPNSLIQTSFNFLTYDEMVTYSIKVFEDNYLRGITLLSNSVEKALSARYGLAADEARRVVLDVTNRHFQDKYDTKFF